MQAPEISSASRANVWRTVLTRLLLLSCHGRASLEGTVPYLRFEMRCPTRAQAMHLVHNLQ